MTIQERIKQISDPSKLNYNCFGEIVSRGDSFRKSSKPYIVCSISGGRSSGMMAYILENCALYDEYEKVYVFMNTGREDQRTIKFLRDIQDHIIKKPIYIIESKVYHNQKKSCGYTLKDWDNLSMNGEPFEEVIKKYGLPSIEYLHCSRELKINPINAFIKEYLGLSKSDFRQAIGIRGDEIRRYKCDPDNFIYPLIDFYITKKTVNNFWDEPELKPFDLGGGDWDDFEGNCDFCFKKGGENLVKMVNKHPSKLEWWEYVEDKYDNGYPIYRDHKTTKDIRNNTMGKQQQLDCLCGNTTDLFFDN